MGLVVSVEEIHEQSCVADETAGAERIRKRGYCHRIVIDTKEFIDFKLLRLDLLAWPWVEAKGPYPEHAIIHVRDSEVVSRKVLLDLIHLDACTSEKLFEQNLIIF